MGGFKKGMPRPSGAGRKKGTPNKSSVLVREALARRDFDLVDEILNRIERLPCDEQVRALIALLPYAYPKLVAMQIELPPSPEAKAVASIKSFSQFCIDAGYPPPYPKQIEMREFGNGPDARLLLGARGYGKTDYAVVLGFAYEIYLDPTFTLLIITKSDQRNAAMLDEMAKALTANGVVLEKQAAHAVRVKGLIGKDHSISAVSLGSKSLRGRHPKKVVMDDPVTEDDVSEATRRKVQRVYNEVTKLTPNVLVIGQPVHKFDLYETLRPLLNKMEVPHGSIPELDHDLEAQRLAGVSEESIQASYFLKVISDSGSPFDRIQYLDMYPMGDSVAYLDPSFKGIDYTALSIMRAHFDGVAVQGKAWKKAWNHCVEDIATDLKKFRVKRLCIECNSLGDQPVLMMRQALQGSGIGVVGKDSITNKHSRIMNAGSFAERIFLARTSDRVYTDQVVKYEYGIEHDDAPDSLASGLEWIGLIRGK